MKESWWKESVVYQIYPRSFCDSDGDGVGDLPGILSKLEYLKTLGIDVIWLSPIYESPNDDNGYDISNYQEIMKEFGTMEDFDALLSHAHALGIKIMLDLVVNHCSDEHRWFMEAKKSKDNPYRDFFLWEKGKQGADGLKTPSNWGGSFGGSAWEYDEATEMYYLHCFSKKQPDLNWENNEVREEIFKMMRWWLDKGVDGFRMDVINMISKQEGFPDGETYGGQYGDFSSHVMNGPKVHDYLKEMNQKVLSKYDVITVGETPCVGIEDGLKYAGFEEGELNMIFQFELMGIDEAEYGKWTEKRLDLLKLKQVISKWQEGLNGKAWNSLFWDNHDQPRIVSRWGNDKEYHELSAKMLATCLHMLQGTPYIYQGEELGMTNCPFAAIDEFRDIESLNKYKEFIELGMPKEEAMKRLLASSRDNARTPMQWNANKQAGFTAGTPWISVNPNYITINAEAELEDKTSVFHYYKKLIELRHQNKCVVYGDYKLLAPEDRSVYAYVRSLEKEKLFIACNFTKKEQTFEWMEVLSGLKEEAVQNNEVKIQRLIGNYEAEEKQNILRPYEAFVYQILY